jgi:hypothetical protein
MKPDSPEQWKRKLLLINGGIAAGLIFCWYRGYPNLALGISAVVLFGLANIILAAKRPR